ncbi:MAG: transposase [Candidatus Aenigmarchaeota archaeon]|nr:transposase [Candidatus Aenigmarchaeota archaeon]MDI6721955.1 transposase [Candidatus Aenigmarchaeota archaeon]
MKNYAKRKLKTQFLDNTGKKFAKFVSKYIEPYIVMKTGKTSQYKPDDYSSLLLFAACEELSVEVCSEKLAMNRAFAPVGKAMLNHIKQFSLDQMYGIADNMLYGSYRAAKLLGLFKKPVCIAIDVKAIMFYGDKNSPMIRGTKPKNGTCWAYEYICLDIIECGQRFTLAFFPVHPLEDQNKLVLELLKTALKLVKIDILAMDREFFSVEIVNMLKRLNIRFIIPAKDTDTVQKLKKENRHFVPVVVPYRMESGKEFADVNLALIKKDDEIHGYITNAELFPQTTAEYYDKRWGIETDNRVMEQFRAMTTSTDYKVRFMYVLMAVAMRNFWVLANLILSIEVYNKPSKPLFKAELMKEALRIQTIRKLGKAAR